MSFGRYQQGEEVWLRVQCFGTNHVASWPTEAPVAAVYNSAGLVTQLQLPMVDERGQVGLFGLRVYLNTLFYPDYYRVLTRYRVAGKCSMEEESFEVIPGGDADGAVISLYSFLHPSGEFIIQQRDGGRLFAGGNPRW